MIFNKDTWEFAGKVIQSAGYESCVEFLERTLPKAWQNGLAAHITHKVDVGRADIAPTVEYRDGTVEEIK